MAQNFIQDGKVISVTLGGTVAAGAVVVVGSMVGIALVGGVNGDVISVMLEGVFELTKDAPLVISQGDEVFWNVTNSEVTKTATDTPLGIAVAGAAEAATKVIVKLHQIPALGKAANVVYTAGTNLVGVDGTGSNAAPLAGTETRLDSLDTAVGAILTALKAAGLMDADA
jgi:predicted RecA/RadA family phage recombinase